MYRSFILSLVFVSVVTLTPRAQNTALADAICDADSDRVCDFSGACPTSDGKPGSCVQRWGGCDCEAKGACCLPGPTCDDQLTAYECNEAGGTYGGDETECGDVTCPLPTGACCGAQGCIVVSLPGCTDSGFGKYRGDDTVCEEECPDGVPTVSEWGLVALVLLVLAAGTVVIMRRRPVAA